MEGYLNHHLKVAGIKEQLFSEEALLAIHQRSGGLLYAQENSTFSNIGLEGIERGDK
jgi:type II secretory pathway predicted ATPase ExeA